MAVNLTLSEQQAALLFPLLQQITKASTGINIRPDGEGAAIPAFNNDAGPNEEKVDESSALSAVNLSSKSTADEPNDSSTKLCSSYTTLDLLQKKKKNTKSTEAQNCLLVRKYNYYTYSMYICRNHITYFILIVE